MSKSKPPQVKDEDAKTHIFDWKVPITVDGAQGPIDGTLDWVPLPGGGLPTGLIWVAARRADPALHRRLRAAPPRATATPAGSPRRPGDPRRPHRSCAPARGSRCAAAGARAGARAARGHDARARRGPAERAPGQVVLRFSEPVEIAFGAVRVFDADGSAGPAGRAVPPGGRDDEVAVRLRDGLADGGYTATYRVVSADSHPVSGGFVFSVGDEAAAPARQRRRPARRPERPGP